MSDLGDPLNLTATVRDDNGDLVSCATMTLTITLPDSTTTAPVTVTAAPAGTYSYDYTPVQAGRHVAHWAGVTPTFAYTDTFNVWPADPRFLFGLDEAKQALGTAWSTDRSNDDDLRGFIAATTAIIEDIVGPLIPCTVTQSFDGGRPNVILRHKDITVTAVTVYGSPWTMYVTDPVNGIVWAGTTLSAWTFPPGQQNVTITYTAGSAVIPPNVALAAKEQLRFLWQLGRQGNRPGFGDVESSTEYTPSGYAVPRTVIELCAANQRAPGV